MFRPFVTRTLTFQDRGRRTNTVQLFNAEKAVQESVQEVYWEVSLIIPFIRFLVREWKLIIEHC